MASAAGATCRMSSNTYSLDASDSEGGSYAIRKDESAGVFAAFAFCTSHETFTSVSGRPYHEFPIGFTIAVGRYNRWTGSVRLMDWFAHYKPYALAEIPIAFVDALKTIEERIISADGSLANYVLCFGDDPAAPWSAKQLLMAAGYQGIGHHLTIANSESCVRYYASYIDGMLGLRFGELARPENRAATIAQLQDEADKLTPKENWLKGVAIQLLIKFLLAGKIVKRVARDDQCEMTEKK